MQMQNHLLEIPTAAGIQIYDVTAQIQTWIAASAVQNGHVLVFSRHTTTALAINEFEPRLVKDLKVFLQTLAPVAGLNLASGQYHYLHNDLHLRPNLPPDEPMNAHSHLMAVTLSSSEMIPIVDGKLALGTYQSILFFELDGPRTRTLFLQVTGQ